MIKQLQELLKEHSDQVNFNEEEHKYFLNDKELISVSNTLEWFKKGLEKINPFHLKAATHRGNIIHAIIENWLKWNYLWRKESFNIGDYGIYDSASENIYYKNIWKPFLDNANDYINKHMNNGYEVLAVEQILHNEDTGIAGTVDLIMIKVNLEYVEQIKPLANDIAYTYNVDKANITIKIIDWKTGNLRASNQAQLGLYKFMFNELIKSLRQAKNEFKDVDIVINTEAVSLKDKEVL